MAAIPEIIEDSPTVKAIYAALKAKEGRGFSRRLGASIVGKRCARAVWYDFRWATTEDFDGRMLRLFQTGHLAEVRFVHELAEIGCEVYAVDPETGSQFEYTEIDGHFVCKLDAVACGLPEAAKAWHAAEFKTHSAKSFSDLKRHGLRKSKPQHYAQLVVGMHLSGLPRGLYLAVNKDTDELYTERLRAEETKQDAESLLSFARSVIESTRAPEKISTDPDSLDCRFCSHRLACHGATGPHPAVSANVNCRTCCHATPIMGGSIGGWRCERHNKTLSEPEQVRGCDDHLFMPDLISFAIAIDGGDDDTGAGFVDYEKPDGVKWRNSKSEYRSLELTQLPAELVGNGLVDDVKHELGGVVVEVER